MNGNGSGNGFRQDCCRALRMRQNGEYCGGCKQCADRTNAVENSAVHDLGNIGIFARNLSINLELICWNFGPAPIRMRSENAVLRKK